VEATTAAVAAEEAAVAVGTTAVVAGMVAAAAARAPTRFRSLCTGRRSTTEYRPVPDADAYVRAYI
jgi:hypothetical protein